MWLRNVFPNVALLEVAAIEDIAFLVLENAKRDLHNGIFHPGNLVRGIADGRSSMMPTMQQAPPLSQFEANQMEAIVLEAVGWLESERLIARDHTSSDGWYIVTRLGNRVQSCSDMSSYAKRAYLPHEVVRDDIAEVSLSPFLAGRYDEAVRSAFTRLETAIRDAAGYGHDQYGVPMVRDAFHPGKKGSSGALGPLADPDLEFTEREGVAHLFAGAIGYIKNPLSHREMNMDDARLAASRILLANDLMNTLAAHVQKMSQRRTER